MRIHCESNDKMKDSSSVIYILDSVQFILKKGHKVHFQGIFPEF